MQVNPNIIRFITKKKDIMGGWRPIALLNVFYKVLASVQADQIKATSTRIV